MSQNLEQFEKDVEGIKKGALTMAWYLRGGASYTDILNMSEAERKAINEIIESNLEVTTMAGHNKIDKKHRLGGRTKGSKYK